jgi:hypothetical protein
MAADQRSHEKPGSVDGKPKGAVKTISGFRTEQKALMNALAHAPGAKKSA